MFRESVYLRAGGRSCVNGSQTTLMQNKSELVHELVLEAPDFEFWELFLYIEEFGDPKKNNAKVVSRFVINEKGKKNKKEGRLCKGWPSGSPQMQKRNSGCRTKKHAKGRWCAIIR